jgi:hypothetical protein
MRSSLLLPVALLAALSCATPHARPAADTAGVGPAADVERGVLGFLYEGDTTVIEEYTRTARTLEGIVRPQLAGAKFGWARYRVEFGRSGDVERAVLAMGRRSDESKPVRTWTVTFHGREAEIVEDSRPASTRRLHAPEGAIPIFPPSMAMQLEVVRRALRERTSGDHVDVPIMHIPTPIEVHHLTVRWPAPDTAAVSYGDGPPAHYPVDARGRVLGVRDPRTGRQTVIRFR